MQRRLIHTALAIASVLGVFASGLYAWHRYTYPFGASHCCDNQLYLVLLGYADSNGGRFPDGEETPEASLSLIYAKREPSCTDLLCGKTGSQKVVKEILDRGKLLSPETCGWNYVPGLRVDDDFRLALFWDKEGLGHNGQRLPAGGHIVTFVGGSKVYIPAARWQAFLAEQELLLAQCEGRLMQRSGVRSSPQRAMRRPTR